MLSAQFFQTWGKRPYPLKQLIVTIVAMAVLCQGRAQDTTAYEKRNFVSSSGHNLPYRILFPEGYSKDKSYPLVLFLHGAGERGNDNTSQLIHGARMFLDADVRAKYPAIVVFPQCPRESYWSAVKIDRSENPYTLDFDYAEAPTPALEAVAELVTKLSREEAVDPDRRYVMGLSMGGMGTFEMVYRHPRTFAAAVPICGGGDDSRYDKRVRDVAFWLFHGAADAVVNVEESRAMERRLRELEVRELDYTEYPGVNHNSWDSAFAEPELLPWLFSQKR